MLRYPAAIWHPGPPAKQGYGSVYPSPQPKEGFVLHSAEGGLAATLGELDNPAREASWQFTVAKDGRVFQHYSADAVCWHCGVAGDSLPLSAAVGNVALIGMEHEGVAAELVEGAQLNASIKVQQWAYEVIPTLKPPALRSSHWEHGWLSATTCPSGRIPWAAVLGALEVREETDGMRLIKDESKVYVLDAGGKRHLNPAQAGAYAAVLGPPVELTAAQTAAIPDKVSGAVVGATPAQIAKAVNDDHAQRMRSV